MWLVIGALILAGLLLIVAEIIFIPGTTVVGFVGLIFALAGVIFSYSYYGEKVGSYILIGTGVAAAAVLFISFQKGVWNRFSNKASIDSKVNEGMTSHLNPGEEGVSVSVLRPMGSAEFGGKIFEVRTNGEYITNGVKIRIIKIQSNNILVEPVQ